MSASLNGGYTVQNENLFDERYKCGVCSHLLKDPIQLTCGDRICQTCVQAENNFIRCLKCGAESIASEVKPDKGINRDMQKLTINCISCEWSGQLRNYQNHLQQIHHQYKCSFCNQTFDSLQLLKHHEERLCTETPMYCILQQYGCKEQIRRSDLQRHFLTKEHQRAILFCVNQISSQFIERHQTWDTNVNTDMQMETSNLLSKVSRTSSTSVEIKGNIHGLEYFYEMINLLSSGIRTLKDDVIRINSETSQLSQLVGATDKVQSTIKISIEESKNESSGMMTNLTILQQEVFSLKQKYDDRQITSFDGTLIWKINGFQEKMNDAKSERQASIYSPPFRSSPTGYKMCARLYLYGDGNARRTHMSLFFVLMRGPHDAILTFPFNNKVTFCLFDQTAQQCHIIDSFRPDTKSNSFQRPRSDMNIASGIPKFAQLSIFEKPDNPYVRDDTMFIKVMVDFENMPKTILPYALSLNPALPMHAQQWMIRQEIERRAQQSQLAAQITLAGNDLKKN